MMGMELQVSREFIFSSIASMDKQSSEDKKMDFMALDIVASYEYHLYVYDKYIKENQ